MAVTAIKSFDNDSRNVVVVENKERNQTVTIRPGGSRGFDIWIPHCASEEDFTANHYLKIEVLAFNRNFYIWQEDAGGIDAVRFTQGAAPRWEHNAARVPGFNSAGGNRMLEIHEDGGIEFHESAK
jgi:hypothetical protein